jgi:hypothetical protein
MGNSSLELLIELRLKSQTRVFIKVCKRKVLLRDFKSFRAYLYFKY